VRVVVRLSYLHRSTTETRVGAIAVVVVPLVVVVGPVSRRVVRVVADMSESTARRFVTPARPMRNFPSFEEFIFRRQFWFYLGFYKR